MTWFYWFTFNGLAAAEGVMTPTLFVHSTAGVFPDNVKQVHLCPWTEGACLGVRRADRFL